MDAAKIAKISKALADPTRLRIYEAIASQPEICCSEIIDTYGLSPGTVSHHLKTLMAAGLIACQRDGHFVHSRPVPQTMRAYTQTLARMIFPRAKLERTVR